MAEYSCGFTFVKVNLFPFLSHLALRYPRLLALPIIPEYSLHVCWDVLEVQVQYHIPDDAFGGSIHFPMKPAWLYADLHPRHRPSDRQASSSYAYLYLVGSVTTREEEWIMLLTPLAASEALICSICPRHLIRWCCRTVSIGQKRLYWV